MPANKEALIRYRTIDRMLRNERKPYPSMEDFLDEFQTEMGKSFSDSTIQKDIKAMKEDALLGYNAPIKYSKTHKGYYYDDPNFTIAEIPLSDNDIQSIEFAALVLKQFKDVKLFNEFGSAVDKIFNAIKIGTVLDVEDVNSKVQMEQIPFFKGSEYLNDLLECTKENIVISFDYRRFDAEAATQRILHPYLLKEYRNRWYVLGYSEASKMVKTYGLDRISNIQYLRNKKFKFDHTFSASTYFKHAYGITTFQGKPEKVVLKFAKQSGQYIKTAPLHETQKIVKETNNEVTIELQVGITTELEMDILSFGEWVEVLKPASLRDAILSKLNRMNTLYK